MTPEKRLDQIEPILADVAQKTDRLIESNGQILQLSVENKADIKKVSLQVDKTARGLAALTLTVNNRFEKVDQRFDQLSLDVDQRFDKVDQRFEGVDRRFDQLSADVDQRFESVDQRFDQLRTEVNQRFENQDTSIQEIKSSIVDLHKGQARIEENQQQLIDFLRDRLG